MSRVPELTGTSIRDSAECTVNWGPQIRRKHRLPHHYHAERGVRIPLQDLLDRGGPPQASRSSGRKKKQQPGPFRRFVEGLFEGREIRGGEREERFLAGRRRGIHSQVYRQKNQDHCKNADREEFLLHLAAPEK
jgi:hypothetical protein